MSENESNSIRGYDENDNAYRAERETISMGKTTEKIIATAVHTGLKIGEAKEKLVVSKDNKKLYTDRKNTNFHREKRNNRLQVDRLSALDDNGIDNEDTEDNNTDYSKNAENNTAPAENFNSEKSEAKELDGKPKGNAQRKKIARLKMRERMREQRQRLFLDERHDPKNAYSQFYNNDFADLEHYDSYRGNDSYEDYSYTQPSKLTKDTDTVMDSSPNKNDDTYKDKAAETAKHRLNDERTKPINTDKSDKIGKLKINKKTQGLKQEKSEVKLKTDKRDGLDIPLNKSEDKLDSKQRKLRKKQSNNIVKQKYILKKARLAHASSISKLIINSKEEKNSPTPQSSTKTGLSQGYAEQEQENFNRNLVNAASTGLKSVIVDFENFEANLFSEDNRKALQKKFTKKKQQKNQQIKKKSEKAKELKLQTETLHNKNRNKENVNARNTTDKGKRDYVLNNTGEGKQDNLCYSLNNRETNTALNKRDNDKSINTVNNGTSKKKVNININKNHSENYAIGSNGKNYSIENTPTDNKGNKNSRLKHDKKLHNRKTDVRTVTGEKLKFTKEHASRHEHREGKLYHDRNKGKNGENPNTFMASKKEKERQKAMQKISNKKAMQKKARKNQKQLSRSNLQFGKKAGKSAANKTLETVKFLARLLMKKIIAIILFLIGKIAIVGTFIMIPVIIIAIIGVIFLGTAGTMLLSSYLADDEILSQVSVYYSDKERDLTNSLAENAIKASYNVDDVNYVFVDNIGHNPHYLLSYLTAKYQNFTFDQVQGELDTIFSLHYTKTITIRDVDVPIFDPYGVPTGEYATRKIADVTLKNNGFYDILYSRLSSDEREHFLLLLEATGNRQYGGFPMSWDWLTNVTEDFSNQNNGVEAEVPVNTAVYGTINGEIVNATADSVSIQGSIGEETIIITFSRLNSVAVNVGAKVQMTTIVGYTSDRIFIQIQRNGVYVNPVLFLGSQRQDLVYGTSIPPLTQSEFNALRDFASTAIGTPYVFGGTGPPPRGIDCSGFIWWAYNGSGIKSWGRTTAQGQFNQCDPITSAEARPGDLIFFQGTYDTKDSRVVTHVGIYLGNGQMQHSGTPNQITSINSAYWQNHFYSFGRLRR